MIPQFRRRASVTGERRGWTKVMQLEFRVGSATDVGGRTRNEDRLVEGARLIAVADGMGGHDAGDVASQMAADELARLSRMPSLEVYDVVASIQRANDRIAVASRGLEGRARMGTTVTGAALVDEHGRRELLVFNVGDSRTYLLRGAQLEQLTHDDSLVNELIAVGELVEEERSSDARRNVLTRVLGSALGTAPSTSTLMPQPGDRLLACSDGISDVLDEAALLAYLDRATPSAAAEALCQGAMAARARDNMTVVVADIVATADEPAGGDADTLPPGWRSTLDDGLEPGGAR